MELGSGIQMCRPWLQTRLSSKYPREGGRDQSVAAEAHGKHDEHDDAHQRFAQAGE